MFSIISKSFIKILDKIRTRGSINEKDLSVTLREIRISLLEADVALSVVKKFINDVQYTALNCKIYDSVTPADMITKIVQDNMTELLKSEDQALHFKRSIPIFYMLVGSQGVGKTTNAAKIALYLRKKHNKKVLLVSLDNSRPLAHKQLEVLSRQINIPILNYNQSLNLSEVSNLIRLEAKKQSSDIIILDTSGRMHNSSDSMQELINIKTLYTPTETLLVVDIMTGQDIIKSTQNFSKSIGITGLILTKMDSEAKGGAALSVKSITGCPIKFISNGEKLSNFEYFYPERISSRILDKGDVVSLVEKAAEIFNKNEKYKKQNKELLLHFNMNDLKQQFLNMRKLGGISSIIQYLPGLTHLNKKIDINVLKKQEAIIDSMNHKEKINPRILNASRKLRIAKGAGLNVHDINKLLKQFGEMKKIMSQYGKSKNIQNKIQNLFKI